MIEIKKLTNELCKEASQLESRCLSTAWSESQLSALINDENYIYVTASEGQDLVGVGGAIFSSIDSAEIFTVAVSKENRGKGIGKEIVSKLIDFCVSKNAESIFLEVEDGNTPAISLYSSFGFKAVGKRKGFYHGKDAIIMELKLKQL
jgi:ribosomal-protein-alanine N-acetyltransferase